MPGWNWISYYNAEVMTITDALGSFTPMQGDVIKSQSASSRYVGNRWVGGITHFMPGQGYMYYSAREDVVSFEFVRYFSEIVTTLEPSNITNTSALVGGTVTVPEGGHVFLRGVCWSRAQNLDIDGSHTTNGSGPGDFSALLESLSPATTYYVCAYVISDNGLIYGNVVSFTTQGNTPVGAINGKYTIDNEGNQVYFSRGNLQYIGSSSTPYWKFAENQWEVLGSTTGQNDSSQNVDRDLFGWGTSGWDNGNTCYHPWETYNSAGASYGPRGAYDLTGTNANADWGVYNPIFNGGNQSGQWRTLTKNEWQYVFDLRETTSGIRFAKANVNNVNGVILLPDDWSTSYYDLIDTNTNSASFTSNTLTVSDWMMCEQYGAVFLPATGYRFGIYVYSVGNNGYYWSSSFFNSSYACGVYFIDSNLNSMDCSNRTYGRGVRLVTPFEN